MRLFDGIRHQIETEPDTPPPPFCQQWTPVVRHYPSSQLGPNKTIFNKIQLVTQLPTMIHMQQKVSKLSLFFFKREMVVMLH
jgi:hypothetical protein